MRQDLIDKIDLLLNKKRNVVMIPPIEDKKENDEFWEYVKTKLKNNVFMTSYKGTVYIRLVDAMGCPLTDIEKIELGCEVEFSLGKVMNDFAICEDGELANNLLLHYKENAEEICRILRADSERKLFNEHD